MVATAVIATKRTDENFLVRMGELLYRKTEPVSLFLSVDLSDQCLVHESMALCLTVFDTCLLELKYGPFYLVKPEKF